MCWATVEALRRDWDELRQGRLPVLVPTDDEKMDVRLVMPDQQAFVVRGRLDTSSGMPVIRVRLGVGLRQKIARVWSSHKKAEQET